jgi:threonine dehydrogenase-like Zn-dependent dehydrogenase
MIECANTRISEMRAVLCIEPGKLERREVDWPQAREGWIAIDIVEIGVCGTDFHIFEGTHPYLQYPRIMGHELSAVVAEGSGSERLPPGTHVVVNPYLSCGHCIACRKGRFNCCMTLQCLGVHTDGGMCEQIVMPEGNLYPAGLLSQRDAAMVEFLAIGAHAVRRSAIGDSDRSLVVGAGPIGIATALFARAAGAQVTFMDISEGRLNFVRDTLGFGEAILAGAGAKDDASRKTGGEFYDCVFDATGNVAAMEASVAFVAHAGPHLHQRGLRRAALVAPWTRARHLGRRRGRLGHGFDGLSRPTKRFASPPRPVRAGLHLGR